MMEWIWLLSILLVSTTTSTLADEDCGNHGNCYGIGEILLDSDVDDKTVTLHWEINSTDQLYGFKVIAEDKEDGLIYESPILNKHAKSMIIHGVLERDDVEVCVLVLLNMTEIIAKKCSTIDVNDLQIYVGILAGIVFLIPCIVALSFIIYKDRQISKAPPDDPSEVRVLIKAEPDIETLQEEKNTRANGAEPEGKVNPCFESEASNTGEDTGTKPATEVQLSGINENAQVPKKIYGTKDTDTVKEDGTKPPGTKPPSANTEKEETENSKIFVIRL